MHSLCHEGQFSEAHFHALVPGSLFCSSAKIDCENQTSHSEMGRRPCIVIS